MYNPKVTQQMKAHYYRLSGDTFVLPFWSAEQTQLQEKFLFAQKKKIQIQETPMVPFKTPDDQKEKEGYS